MASPLEALAPGATRKRLALVLSGGGNLGVVQVPFLQELLDLDVHPDLIVGASVGSLNGAFLAFHPDNLSGLAELWLSLRDQRLWSRNLLEIGRSLLFREMSLYRNDFLRRLIEPHVALDEISGGADPAVHHRDQSDQRPQAGVLERAGGERDLGLRGGARPVPAGAHPRRVVRGRDRGDRAGLGHRDRAGSDGDHRGRPGRARPSPHRPNWLGDVIARSWEIAVERRTERELDHLAPEVPTVVLRPGLSAHRSASFSDVEQLYEAARGMAPHMIARARPPGRPLDPRRLRGRRPRRQRLSDRRLAGVAEAGGDAVDAAQDRFQRFLPLRIVLRHLPHPAEQVDLDEAERVDVGVAQVD